MKKATNVNVKHQVNDDIDLTDFDIDELAKLGNVPTYSHFNDPMDDFDLD